MYENIIEKLYQEYSVHGYISEDRVFEVLEKNRISLIDSDSVVDNLLSRGVIIRDNSNEESNTEDDDYDKCQYDYEEIYNTILEIDPELKILLEYVRNIKAPQHREWKVLLPQAQSGNTFARNRLFEMYMRSVLRIALQFSQRYEQPLADTIQNGMIGLYISIDKFEFGRQENFPQYYPLWVLQQIRRESEAFNPTVYYPMHVKEESFTVYEICQNHFCENCNSRYICPELISKVQDALKCDEPNAVDAIQSLNHFESFEEQFEIDDSFDLEDTHYSVEDSFEQESLKECVKMALHTLTPKEEEILKLRYGFIDNKEYTLEKAGYVYGVTRERIRQIEEKALKRLRHSSRSNLLK